MILKSIFALFFIQLITLTGFGQKTNCKSLQIGSFKVTTSESGTTIIDRTRTEQHEINEDLGYDVLFDIKWIDECSYELRPKKVIKGDPAIMGDGTNVVKTRIKQITDKGYVAETSASFSNATIDFTVEILH